MRIPRALLLCAACCALFAVSGAAQAPYALERLFAPPWLFGTSLQSVTLSDDGRWLACGWDEQAESHRDLWVRDNSTGAWFQLTDYWPEREARRRREFARDLAKARVEWEAAHPPKDETKAAGTASTSADDAAEAAAKQQETFDERKRIDDFEKDLKKQRETFGGIGQTLFLRGSHELLWLYDGVVYSVDLDQAPPEPRERLRHEQGFWNLSLPPRDTAGDGADAVLLASDADIFLWYPHGGAGRGQGALRQLTTGGYGDRPNDQGYAITPDLQWLAHVSRDYSATRKTQIPELLSGDPYTTSSSHIRPGDTPESASLTLLDLSTTPPWPVEVKLPEAPHYNVCQVQWSPVPGERRLLLGVITIDTRELKLYLITPPDTDEGQPGIELAYRERDDKWLNWDLMSAGFDAQGGLFLQSERDGRSRLYRLAERVEPAPPPAPAAAEDEAPADAEKQQQEVEPAAPAAKPAKEDWGKLEPQLLFESAHEITSVSVLTHSQRAIVQVAEPDPSCRSLLLLDMATGQAQPLFPEGASWRAATALNDAETVLAYSVGDERHMSETALLNLPAPGQAPQLEPDHPIRLRLAESAQSASGWQAWADGWDVRFITVPGAAGPIPVKLYLPPGWRKSGDYPLLLWAHGAGYAQTVVRQPGFLELFHPWAAQQLSWIVAEVDYRGSSGYGRDWRVGVWGNLGHGEVDDLVSVKHYLMEHYGADARRTALWGWSYGGYLTLMALGLKPGEFPVGCAVAPVTRWENYHSYFSTCRLGLPAENKAEYERSSAETYLKDVKDHLLIIHGLRDDNTVFQSVAQYIEKSHELGVNVELKLFPSDSHGIGNERHYIRVFQEVLDYAQVHWAEDAQ